MTHRMQMWLGLILKVLCSVYVRSEDFCSAVGSASH